MIGFRVGEASAPGFIQSFLTSIRRFFTRIAAVSVWGVRGRLVVISLTVIAIVSFAFGTLSNLIVTRWIYDDFRRQAFIFGYEISATVSNRQEFEARDNLEGDLNRIMTVRTDVLQMDILRFSASGTNIIATSNPSGRLPFLRRDIDVVRAGRHVSLFVNRPGPRTWAIMVPIIIDGAVMGGAQYAVLPQLRRDADIADPLVDVGPDGPFCRDYGVVDGRGCYLCGEPADRGFSQHDRTYRRGRDRRSG